MGICWPLTHRQLSAVFEVKQLPDWALRAFLGRLLLFLFKAVTGGTSVRERRTEGQDSHRCLINV